MSVLITEEYCVQQGCNNRASPHGYNGEPGLALPLKVSKIYIPNIMAQDSQRYTCFWSKAPSSPEAIVSLDLVAAGPGSRKTGGSTELRGWTCLRWSQEQKGVRAE